MVAELDYPVSFVTSEEGGGNLGGVKIVRSKRVIATTNEAGVAHFSLKGREGDTASLTIDCPAAYSSPQKAVVVGLRHLSPGSPKPRFEAKCVRLHHSIVVGVRAEKGPNLPIVRLGKVVGSTDETGAAHLRLETTPNEQVSLKLDTTGNDALRPESPTLTFVSVDKDELVLLEQKFTVKPKIVRVAKKNIPTPLTSPP